jgi:NAD(P)-dependent dehydrogenase (short-subunit alcohol dehydrogenase family)
MSKNVLITGATGSTGRPAVRESIALGMTVRAMVRKKDARSEALEKLGAEVVVGDFFEINTLRDAMQGVEAASLCYPVAPGLIPATVNFGQPGRRNSGQSEPQMRISKEGGPYLRALLVQAAHHLLGPWGIDSDLRR